MLQIIGIVAIVVFTYQVYKTANGTERNGALWAVLTAAIGVGFQFVIPIVLGIVLAIAYMAMGTHVEDLQSEVGGLALILGIGSIILSIVGMVLVMKHVSKVKDDEPAVSKPPPPPNFGPIV